MYLLFVSLCRSFRVHVRCFLTTAFGTVLHGCCNCSVRLCSDETTVVSCGLDGEIIEWSLHRIGKIMRQFKVVGGEHYRTK